MKGLTRAILLVSAAALPVGCLANASSQVTAGKSRFNEKCARCHGPTMAGTGHATALRGEVFRAKWNGKSARELYKRIISTMPQDDPGGLPQKDVISITAYVLATNGVTLPPIEKANDLNNIQLQLNP